MIVKSASCTVTCRLHLSVNLDKSIIITFQKGGYIASTESWRFGGNRLAVVNSYRYLGRTFSSCLSFQVAVDNSVLKNLLGHN